jgi:hypothetical protein
MVEREVLPLSGIEPRSSNLRIVTLLTDLSRSTMWWDVNKSGDMRVYPKVCGLAAWSENCKWYSSVPLGAVVSLFCESV